MIDPRRARCGRWLVAALWCGCSAGPSSAEVEQAVQRYFAQRDIEPQAVRCPALDALPEGHALTCTATIDDQALAVHVERTVTDTVVRPEQATLVTARVEPQIAAELRGQGYAVTRVRCEGQVWVVHPAAEHHCEVRVRDGRRYDWRGVFSGEGADHRAFVTPLAGEGPA